MFHLTDLHSLIKIRQTQCHNALFPSTFGRRYTRVVAKLLIRQETPWGVSLSVFMQKPFGGFCF